MQGNIQSYCTSCDACQRRKTPHRRPPLPTGHVPVERPFQRDTIDLVDSRAYHIFDNMDDAHCIRDEGGFTVHWLLCFIGLGLGLGYI